MLVNLSRAYISDWSCTSLYRLRSGIIYLVFLFNSWEIETKAKDLVFKSNLTTKGEPLLKINKFDLAAANSRTEYQAYITLVLQQQYFVMLVVHLLWLRFVKSNYILFSVIQGVRNRKHRVDLLQNDWECENKM